MPSRSSFVADAVVEIAVDGRQAVDVEQDDRQRLPGAARAIDFLSEHGVERGPRIERGEDQLPRCRPA